MAESWKQRQRYSDDPYRGRRAPAREELPDTDRGGLEQGGSYAHRGRDYYGHEGRFRGSQRVSPGGEFLSEPSRRYASEDYSAQGFGEPRGRSDWRTEDKTYPDYRGRGPRGYTRSDQRIHEDACERLTDDPRIDASSLEVRVSEGEITLTGTVSSRADKRLAEDLIEHLPGVKDVHNQLRVAIGEPGERAASPSARH